MLADIKQMMIKQPESIVSLLQEYDFHHINLRPTEVRFARNSEGGQNISIKLTNNDSLFVKDFVLNDSQDLIGYIMKYRDQEFRTVLMSIKKILNLSDDWAPAQKQSLFGGFYDDIGNKRVTVDYEYPENIMNRYEFVGNKRWLKDGIPLSTQKKYGVHYDTANDLIVFPWRSSITGGIISVKARINFPQEEDMSKYYYPCKGAISRHLYGFNENYAYLVNSDKIYVVEAEKTVQITDAWNIHNCVALGSHTLSEQQAKLLISLNPKEIWFMLDRDLDLAETKKNAEVLKRFMEMNECKIKYWDWTENHSVREKGAPVDEGLTIFDEICEHEIKDIGEL